MMPAIIWFADWSSFYLFCFAFGFIFSLFAFLSGHLHLPGEHGGHHVHIQHISLKPDASFFVKDISEHNFDVCVPVQDDPCPLNLVLFLDPMMSLSNVQI